MYGPEVHIQPVQDQPESRPRNGRLGAILRWGNERVVRPLANRVISVMERLDGDPNWQGFDPGLRQEEQRSSYMQPAINDLLAMKFPEPYESESGRSFKEAMDNAKAGLSPNPTEEAEKTIQDQVTAAAQAKQAEAPIQSPQKTAKELEEEKVADWKNKLAAGHVASSGEALTDQQIAEQEVIKAQMKAKLDQELAQIEVERAEDNEAITEWRAQDQELRSDPGKADRLEEAREAAEQEKLQQESEVAAETARIQNEKDQKLAELKAFGKEITDKQNKEKEQQEKDKKTKEARQKAGQVDQKAKRAAQQSINRRYDDEIEPENEPDTYENDDEYIEVDDESIDEEHESSKIAEWSNPKDREPDDDSPEVTPPTERKILGFKIPPSREQLKEAMSSAKGITDPFLIGMAGGAAARLTFRMMGGMDDLMVEHWLSTSIGAAAGGVKEMIPQIKAGNDKYRQKLASERQDIYASRLFSSEKEAKMAELEAITNESEKRKMIEDALKVQGITNQAVINNYLNELDNSNPELKAKRLSEIKLCLKDRLVNNGINVQRTINAIMLAAGGAYLGSSIAGIGEIPNTSSAAPSESGTTPNDQAKPTIPETAAATPSPQPDAEIKSPGPSVSPAQPTESLIPPQPMPPVEQQPQPPVIPAAPEVVINPPIIDWDQNINIKPGSNFWSSINLDQLTDWDREGYFQPKSEVIKDAISKFSAANGHPLNIVQPGQELNLNELLTGEQRDIVNQIAKAGNVHDYLDGGLKGQVQDMLNQARNMR